MLEIRYAARWKWGGALEQARAHALTHTRKKKEHTEKCVDGSRVSGLRFACLLINDDRNCTKFACLPFSHLRVCVSVSICCCCCCCDFFAVCMLSVYRSFFIRCAIFKWGFAFPPPHPPPIHCFFFFFIFFHFFIPFFLS